MRFYQDVTQAQEPRQVLAALADLLRACAAAPEHTAQARSRRIDALREALIRAGMLEQSIADTLSAGGGDAGAARAAQRHTQAIAGALAIAWDGRQPAWEQLFALAGALARRLGGHGALPTTVPEGYLFYGLFPELYRHLGQSIARTLTPETPVVVVGVRSIGTSLSAMLAEGVRARGRRCLRISVRPFGDPFAREVALPRAVALRLRRAAARGAYAVAVDEGPGLSGTSLAATVGALRASGFDAERVLIACANPPTTLPHAAPDTVRIWETTRWYAARDLEAAWWRDDLPALLGDALGGPLRPHADLSWGGWRAHRAGMHEEPLALPGLERRKVLLRRDEGLIIAKFVGFTQLGSAKARIAATLAAAGLTPPVLGFAHGMLMQRWLLDGVPCDEPPIAAAAAYYAYLRRACSIGERVSLSEAMEPATAIVRDWFGSRFDPLLRHLHAASGRILVEQIDGDEKPERIEWLMDQGAVLKVDVADHFLDHSWARRQDSCFDLAGFSQEFDLAPAQEELLLQQYGRRCGDLEARARLPYYHLIYAAHRLAALDTAYHAAGDSPAAHIDARRRHYAATLERTLVERMSPCVC